MTEPLDIDDTLLTVKQVAEIFQVTQYTVRWWINEEHKIKAVKIGNRLRIPKSQVVKFANERYGGV